MRELSDRVAHVCRLRRIERERVAVSKMRQIGQEVPKSMGVRYEMRVYAVPPP